MSILAWTLCHLGIHAWCPRGINPPGSTNRCPYWSGWRDGYAFLRSQHPEGG